MKLFKSILVIFTFFIFSCGHSPYLKDYEAVRVFMIKEKIDSSKTYILQKEKVDNKNVISDFKDYKSSGPYFDSNFNAIPYHNEKEFKKMSHKYINDTIKKYWEKDDFVNFNFIIKKSEELRNDSLQNKNKIYISEPMFFWKKKYLIFNFYILNYGGGISKLVFMKKENNLWKVDKVISSDVFF
jgi:hypothetical protein